MLTPSRFLTGRTAPGISRAPAGHVRERANCTLRSGSGYLGPSAGVAPGDHSPAGSLPLRAGLAPFATVIEYRWRDALSTEPVHSSSHQGSGTLLARKEHGREGRLFSFWVPARMGSCGGSAFWTI